MLSLWRRRAHSTKLLAPGKLPGEHLATLSPRCSLQIVNAGLIEIIPALCKVVTSKAAYTLGTTDTQTLQLWCILFSPSQGSCATKEDKTSDTHKTNECGW